MAHISFEILTFHALHDLHNKNYTHQGYTHADEERPLLEETSNSENSKCAHSNSNRNKIPKPPKRKPNNRGEPLHKTNTSTIKSKKLTLTIKSALHHRCSGGQNCFKANTCYESENCCTQKLHLMAAMKDLEFPEGCSFKDFSFACLCPTIHKPWHCMHRSYETDPLAFNAVCVDLFWLSFQHFTQRSSDGFGVNSLCIKG